MNIDSINLPMPEDFPVLVSLREPIVFMVLAFPRFACHFEGTFTRYDQINDMMYQIPALRITAYADLHDADRWNREITPTILIINPDHIASVQIIPRLSGGKS